MRKFIPIVFALVIFPTFLSAQYLEFGAIGGLSTYMGDLSPAKSRLSYGDINRSGGVFIRYNRNDFFTLKLGVNYGQVSAADANSKDAGRSMRNLHFISDLWETSFTVEYNIFGYEPKYMTRRFSPYIFLGVGYFSYNPKSYGPNGGLIELQPLRTEGQGLPGATHSSAYKLRAFSMPIGAGLKFALTEKINIGGEIGLRATSTDYLDDVSGSYVLDDVLAENYGDLSALMGNRSGQAASEDSMRGNPHGKDWYIIGGLTISYNWFDSGNKNRRRRAIGCPTF